MTKTLPNFKGRVTAFHYVDSETIRRALQFAFAFAFVTVIRLLLSCPFNQASTL